MAVARNISLDLEQMLIETVTILEANNLRELLPIEVIAWWDARKAKELEESENDKAEAFKFLEKRVEHWRRISSAE